MTPHVQVLDPCRRLPVRAVAMLLHGGRENSTDPARRFQSAYLRMVPFGNALRRGHAGVAVWLVRNRVRGWNEPIRAPVADARWVLARVRRTHPGVPVVVVGHSMGGRVALRVADDPAVVAVCALAPWTTSADPVHQLAGTRVLIAHGDRDTRTRPDRSYAYAERAGQVAEEVRWLGVRGDGHAMLRRFATWTTLVRGFVLDSLAPTPGGSSGPAPRMPVAPGLAVPL